MADFKVKFASDVTSMPVRFDSGEEVSADFGEVQTVSIGGEVYKGVYAVTPKVERQIMPTKGKLLVKDLTIHQIPYAEVTNNSGGTTATIGGN